jgi:hypothetical protein
VVTDRRSLVAVYGEIGPGFARRSAIELHASLDSGPWMRWARVWNVLTQTWDTCYGVPHKAIMATLNDDERAALHAFFRSDADV